MAYTETQKQDHIRELQGYLHGLSHVQPNQPHVATDGIYGAETAAAVQQFQQDNRLRPNGETNTDTWNAIVDAYLEEVVPPLRALALFPTGVKAYTLGDNGAGVYLIQAILEAIRAKFSNLPPVQVTGTYDANTVQVVKAFQKCAALPETGTVTPDTWNRMVAALGDGVLAR